MTLTRHTNTVFQHDDATALATLLAGEGYNASAKLHKDEAARMELRQGKRLLAIAVIYPSRVVCIGGDSRLLVHTLCQRIDEQQRDQMRMGLL